MNDFIGGLLFMCLFLGLGMMIGYTSNLSAQVHADPLCYCTSKPALMSPLPDGGVNMVMDVSDRIPAARVP